MKIVGTLVDLCSSEQIDSEFARRSEDLQPISGWSPSLQSLQSVAAFLVPHADVDHVSLSAYRCRRSRNWKRLEDQR